MKNKTTATPHPVVGSQPPLWTLWGVTCGLLLVGAGTLMPLFGNTEAYRWIYCAGALVLVLSRIFAPYTGEVIRIKRLYRIEGWSALFFCVGGFFMFYPHGTMRDWLAFTMAGGAIQIYTSFMIPRTVAKELKNRKENGDKR